MKFNSDTQDASGYDLDSMFKDIKKDLYPNRPLKH